VAKFSLALTLKPLVEILIDCVIEVISGPRTFKYRLRFVAACM